MPRKPKASSETQSILFQPIKVDLRQIVMENFGANGFDGNGRIKRDPLEVLSEDANVEKRIRTQCKKYLNLHNNWYREGRR